MAERFQFLELLTMTIESTIQEMAKAAREAAGRLVRISADQKNAALLSIAAGLEKEAAFIKAENELDLLAKASIGLCKYSSILVLPQFEKAMLYTLFALRQNIFTDPQKPIQVEPKIYSIGDPTAESPVFLTTNFSLTYFLVSGEIENSGTSAHLVVCDCEGQSVLTAWAAGKFVGETIAKFIKEINLEGQVKSRKLIIPGFVSQISGDLEEKLPGWEVLVGCQEASDIPAFVKSVSLT